MSNICYPPNYGLILIDVLESLPIWVLELPPESYVAEVSSRIVLHPDTQKFTKGNQHLIDVIQSEFEKILLDKIKQTERYKREYDSKRTLFQVEGGC
jgi:hypothetical protein